ncbi:MAG TPA: vanadium-dependent haloperoxidase, partial [Chitinophagales bacterium]|nr:vanadium-dependent haloperoxidase [Chitinophagales bacterium]
WANSDNYIQTRNMPRFTVVDTPGSWLPTPPKYLEALEPHWFKVRPFVLDSTSQFRKPLWYKFSTDSTSDFYKRVKEVYALVKNLSDEQVQIARFWDDNPSPLNVQGHVVTTNRQNTPGGHWLGIARIAARKKNLSLAETCEALSMTAIAIADAFKVIWDTKYVCNNIRPVTYIGKYIDASWSPVLETPNFPEFSSGHSGISAAAAYVLTQRFGENFSFTDSTNVPFGYPARKFSSFNEAAKEAAMSRVYGGIHYIPSCEIGAEQGRMVGELVEMKIRTRK